MNKIGKKGFKIWIYKIFSKKIEVKKIRIIRVTKEI